MLHQTLLKEGTVKDILMSMSFILHIKKGNYFYMGPYLRMRGPLMVAQWLRYCATNRKVAGSISYDDRCINCNATGPGKG
jgi:hypothetical protein